MAETVDFAGIARAEGRYAPEAYAFVGQALQHAVKLFRAGARGQDRHLSGQELLAGAVDLASARYSVLADLVLRQWGIAGNEDIGEITFILIRHGVFSKRPEDRLEDFAGHPPLAVALRQALRRRLGLQDALPAAPEG